MRALLDKLKTIVGPGGWITDERELLPHVTEWRNTVHGKTPILLMPSDTGQVVATVRACADANVGIVPQGGNTGMCAGAVPDDSGEQVVLNLSRMNRIRSVSADDFSMVAEAGCVLADLQAAARDADRFLPLSLGGEGSCQIGGNLATNAGGINVLRYGTARDLALGIEVVLADGTVWDGIKTLRKDTAGYDLKQLFIGSEGTLGIITTVALKLFPSPGETSTTLVAMNDVHTAVELLGKLRATLADQVLAFELIGSRAMDLVLRHIPDTRLPFETKHAWYALIDAAVDTNDGAALENALENAGASDAIVAKNKSEVEALWRMRHSISEAEKRQGAGVKHDISVPVGSMQGFLDEAERRLGSELPAAKLVVFGHVGDGNLHYNAHLPESMSKAECEQARSRLSEVIYELVTEMGGSISAEHGIGLLKKDALAEYKSETELTLMRTLKRSLDPKNTLNPGKVI